MAQRYKGDLDRAKGQWGVVAVDLSISDQVDVLAPRSRTENEGVAGNRNAIAPRGADIDHGGLFEVGNTR